MKEGTSSRLGNEHTHPGLASPSGLLVHCLGSLRILVVPEGNLGLESLLQLIVILSLRSKEDCIHFYSLSLLVNYFYNELLIYYNLNNCDSNKINIYSYNTKKKADGRQS